MWSTISAVLAWGSPLAMLLGDRRSCSPRRQCSKPFTSAMPPCGRKPPVPGQRLVRSQAHTRRWAALNSPCRSLLNIPRSGKVPFEAGRDAPREAVRHKHGRGSSMVERVRYDHALKSCDVGRSYSVIPWYYRISCDANRNCEDISNIS